MKSAAEGAPLIVNAMTVDVEEWYQAQAFERRIAQSDWPGIPSRVVDPTHTLLDIFAAAEVKATFFVVGSVARRSPDLIRRIVREGHELASHGMSHIRVDRQSPTEFEADARDSRGLLEDVAGAPVAGYRAATFSISEATPWAFEILARSGYSYSSSVFPGRHDIYGMPGAPRTPFQPVDGRSFTEIPMTVVDRFGRSMMAAGGGYFRLFPYVWSHANIAQVNAKQGRPAIFYVHSWEVDPAPPRVEGLSLLSNFRAHVGRARTLPRLRRLLSAFPWGRMDQAFQIAKPADAG